MLCKCLIIGLRFVLLAGACSGCEANNVPSGPPVANVSSAIRVELKSEWRDVALQNYRASVGDLYPGPETFVGTPRVGACRTVYEGNTVVVTGFVDVQNRVGGWSRRRFVYFYYPDRRHEWVVDFESLPQATMERVVQSVEAAGVM